MKTYAPGVSKQPDGLNWKHKYEEFHATMDGTKFTMDFNPSLEAVMADRTASARERVLAWTKRHAWGHFSAYAVDRIGGRPLRQKDCATQLSLGRPKISKTVGALVQSGLMRVEQDSLYPVSYPNASMVSKSGEREAGRWERFFAELTRSNPDLAVRYRDSEQQFNQVKKLVMRQYRVWGDMAKAASRRAEASNFPCNSDAEEYPTGVADSCNHSNGPVDNANHPPSHGCQTGVTSEINETKEDIENANSRSVPLNGKSYLSSSANPQPGTTTIIHPEQDLDSEDVATLRRYLSENGISNDWEIVADLLHRCRGHSPSCSVEQITNIIGQKLAGARDADKPMAWLRTAVPKCFVGSSVILSGCPMPACVALHVNKLDSTARCVNCGLTRETAQKRAASASDPALISLTAMRRGRK